MAVRVAYTVGKGTGLELADIFERVMTQLSASYSIPVELHRSSRVYHSYFSLLADCNDQIAIEEETLKDVLHYEDFCKTQAALGTRVTFKTAINAQSLYLIRQHFQAIKLECFNQGENSLLLIRDQSQGFYTGRLHHHYYPGVAAANLNSGSNEHNVFGDSVSRTCLFSKALTERIIAYSIHHARGLWGDAAPDSVNMVYKFHLFDGVFSLWAEEWSKKYGVRINLVQPDTANRNMLAFGIRGRQLMVAGNEWADIMHVILLNMFGQGAQESRCTENVYLHPELHGLSEYQTVHGSADDLAGKGIVNPSATVRAAAAILERHAGCKGIEEAMDRALLILQRRKAVTPDQGGQMSSTEVVDSILNILAKARTPADGLSNQNPLNNLVATSEDRLSLGKNTAIIVVDFQNDFVTKEGIGSEYRGDMARMAGPIAHIPRVIDFARKQGHEIIFVRFLGDQRYRLPNMQHRDAILGKRPKCLEGSWGAELHPCVQPAAGERVFNKQAHFDAFLCENFERYLTGHGYEHLVFLGVYCDVCVDSTARTAFQKGYYITVVSDCTTTLHLPFQDSLAYLERLCGARIITHDKLTEMGG